MIGRSVTSASVRQRLASREVVAAGLLFVALLLLFSVADGSRQPTSGSGWRLLGYQRAIAGRAHVVELASSADLVAAWEALRLTGSPPFVDDAAVYWFTATGTIGCPSHFAGVSVDAAQHLVVGTFTLALTAGCDDQSVSDSFLIAIDRSRLPSPPIDVQLVEQGASATVKPR